MSRDVLLRATDLHKSYQIGPERLRVLRGVCLDVRRGEFLAVMGASGSGKSTLLHILGALDLPDRGSVQFDGRDLFSQSTRARERLRNRQIGFVFQFYHLLPELNLLENTLLPSMVKHSILGWLQARRGARQAAHEVLTQLGVAARATHRPSELSGGERQRAAIARALVHRPPLLLADEPTGNLDAATGKEILAVLQRLNKEGQTIVMVTHDGSVASLAHRRVHLVEGKVAP